MTPYKQAVVEDTEFLANHGHHWDTISRRLGVSIDAIQKHLREAGRTDITDRITNEVEGINRVLYDLTPKGPGTIEWE